MSLIPLAVMATIAALFLASVMLSPDRHRFGSLLDRIRFVATNLTVDTGSVATFIPEIWSKKLLSSLKKALVYGAPGGVNRDYEGEISEQGDTVHINSVGRPTISSYVAGSTTITPEQLTTAQRSLVIDQAKYFAFEVDDVDARQAAGNVIPEAMMEAAYALGDVADQYLEALYAGVVAANALGTIQVDTAAKAYDNVLIPLKVALDEASVPSDGRTVVVPPWFHGRLLGDDRFIRADASGAAAASVTGEVGAAAGFKVQVSNNAPLVTGDDYRIVARHPMALSYAEQINKTEAYRPESSFSDAVKGLHLYGAKLVRPYAAATAVASKS